MKKDCFDCENCLYICEGDYFCDFSQEIVIQNHSEPTEYFILCKKDNKQKVNVKNERKYSNTEIRNNLDNIVEMNNNEIKINHSFIKATCSAAYNLICSQNCTNRQLLDNNRKRKANSKINKNLRKKLAYLISTYEFDSVVFNDISSHLLDYIISSGMDSGFNNYLSQQIKYLENILKGKGIKIDYIGGNNIE